MPVPSAFLTPTRSGLDEKFDKPWTPTVFPVGDSDGHQLVAVQAAVHTLQQGTAEVLGVGAVHGIM